MASKIWKISNKDFKQLISNSKTYKEAIQKIGMPVKSGGNYRTLKDRIKKENINVSHIEAAKNTFRGKCSDPIPLDKILIKDSSYNSGHLKKRLIKEGLLINECSKCGLGDMWCGESISLQMDHINGDHSDHRLDNLRILCPNCHSQTKTYGRKNSKQHKRSYFCDCGNKKLKQSKCCRSCYKHPVKISWPAYSLLLQMVSETSKTQVASHLGVSEASVRKRLKQEY